MRRRIYVDGKPAWSANEEGGYARRAGFGGAAIGHYQTTFTVKRAAPGTVDPAAAASHRSASQQRAVERKRAYRAANRRSA